MKELTKDQERMLALLKISIDFNTNVMQIAAIEIAGDLSSHNRTHQKKVVEQMQLATNKYRRKLATIYKELEEETKDEA